RFRRKLRERVGPPALIGVLMGGSHFMINNWWWIIGGIVAGVFAFRRWARTDSGRMRLDKLRLRLPAAGAIYLQLALSRFTRILGTLLHNGIPILQALRIAKDSTGNRVLTEAIDRSADNIRSGDPLAAPL